MGSNTACSVRLTQVIEKVRRSVSLVAAANACARSMDRAVLERVHAAYQVGRGRVPWSRAPHTSLFVRRLCQDVMPAVLTLLRLYLNPVGGGGQAMSAASKVAGGRRGQRKAAPMSSAVLSLCADLIAFVRVMVDVHRSTVRRPRAGCGLVTALALS